jgi:hypothetical protein
MVINFGYTLSALTCLGIFVAFVIPAYRRSIDSAWAAVGSYVIGVFLLHAIIPSSIEERHALMASPALLLFASSGIQSLVKKVPSFKKSRKGVHVLLFLLLCVITFETLKVSYVEKNFGFGDVVNRILLSINSNDSVVVLIASDAAGEGMFIADMAMKSSGPRQIILRGTKTLARSDWNGNNYQALFTDTRDMKRYLMDIPVKFVIADVSNHPQRYLTHLSLLEGMLKDEDTPWKEIGRYPLMRRNRMDLDVIGLYVLAHEGKNYKRQRGLGREKIHSEYHDSLVRVYKVINPIWELFWNRTH